MSRLFSTSPPPTFDFQFWKTNFTLSKCSENLHDEQTNYCKKNFVLDTFHRKITHSAVKTQDN